MSNKVCFQEVNQEINNLEHETDVESDKVEIDSARIFNKFELLGESELDEDVSIQCEAKSSDDELDGDVYDIDRTTQKKITTKGGSKRRSRKKRGKKNANKNDKNSSDPFDDEELEHLTKAVVLHSSANETRDIGAKLKLLRVDVRNLVPEAELKKIFGKSVIKEDKSTRRPHPGSNLQRSRFVSSGYFELKPSSSFSAPKMELDELLNKHKPGHPNQKKSNDCRDNGSFDKFTASALLNSDEPVYFKFVHDKQYQEAQKAFLIIVNQGNAESIVQNLSLAPFHAESLIQLSHMIRVSEDYKTASEFIERALIIFEKGFHPKFKVSTATCRVSYKRPENRTFFIAIFKHISYCHRRGLRRTPFEYSKLLLSLEPDNDPLQAVQLLDFYSIRSEEYDYIIEFYSKWTNLQKLPNLTFSIALAHFLKSLSNKQSREESTKQLLLADRQLQDALLLFPNFIIPLLDACSAEPSSELKKCTYFDYSVYNDKYKMVPETVGVLVSLYVKRAYSLWKQKNVILWLEKNVAVMTSRFASGQLKDEGRHLEHWQQFPQVTPKNVLRHIVLCDLDIKLPASASSTFLDIDPYPPTDSIISYEMSNAHPIPSESSTSSFMGGMSGLFLRSFLPSFNPNEP